MEGAIGTQLRHVLELLDGDVAKVYGQLGLAEYRPRFSPIVRALVAEGPLSIRDLAGAVGVTHSAASQTVAQLVRSGFASLEPGSDARQRIVHLTPKTRDLLPTIEAEWQATTAAMAELDAELSAPLSVVLTELTAALHSRPFHHRIAAHTPTSSVPCDPASRRSSVPSCQVARSGGVVEDQAESVPQS